MSVVSIMMGSDKDIDFANIMIQEFNALNIDTKVYVSSAHKNTMQVLYNIGEMDKSKKNIIITIAGMSNALSGVVAANTTCPVIACPPFKDQTDMMVNINSTLQMPSNIPVLTILNPKNCVLAVKRILDMK
jgi:5-(carboxyamino)imidazole ribonucleotide mutase|tara:strand:+ start:254 stop:646 length:393 start_codon:yes stop_codon:yes gene_type:complete